MDGCSIESAGLNMFRLSPSSDTCGLAVVGGSGGLTITWGILVLLFYTLASLP